jgi:copper(I)-binding protein
MRTRRVFLPIGAVLALSGFTMTACGSDDLAAPAATTEAAAQAAAPTVTDAWSRQPADGQMVTAVYGLVSNPTDTDLTIIGVSTPVTDRAELHETIANDDGTMQMQQVESFVVPAGGEFAFESGGPHIMLFDIDPATYPTDSVEVTLTFDSGDPITFAAEVRALDAGDDMGSMDMGDDMGSMDMGDDMDMTDHMDEMGAPDSSALHELDEELAAGTLEPDRQRPIVQEFIAYLEADIPAAGSEQAELLAILQELDAALESGDLPAAAAAATAAHEASHALEDHAG